MAAFKRGDFLGLGKNGIEDAIRHNVPGSLEVVPFYGFEIAPGANSVFKPLSGHGAPLGVFRNTPAFHWPSGCDPHPDRPGPR